MSLVKFYKPRTRKYDKIVNHSHEMPVDIIETEESYIFEAELPGYTAEEIDIEAAADELIIRAEPATEESDDNEETEQTNTPRYIRKERLSRKYMRKFNFRKPVVASEAKTTLKHGILTITMPKAEEAKPVKLIPETN